MAPLRILLVDDHILFRKGIASLIHGRSDLTVVGEAEDGIQAVRVARETRPDLVLMDINMPNQDGIETVKILKQEMPQVKIVMLTVSEHDEDLFNAIKNGAKGYLLKNLEPQQLFDMLEKVRQGEAPISGAMAAKILHEFRGLDNQEDQAGESEALTEREIEVLEQVVTGATNKEIATSLYITENTVKIHLRNILEKLQVQNRIQAAVYAVQAGIVKQSPDKKG
ncbi:MAG TPA: response regulator transcription factor [Anaerolineae bacterium]|nr:response regulator transcription factor [Anaerolineae bacterium]